MRRGSVTLAVKSVLGSGGEAEVLAVSNPWDGQLYALKKFRSPQVFPPPGALGRIDALRHPALLQPVGRRRSDGELTEELAPLIHTLDAREVVSAGGLEVLLSLLIQALAGINALHTAGYLHRDIKPENLLVESTGQVGPWASHRVLVSDFGLATELNVKQATDGITGTLGYLAPELLASRPHSIGSDLFSLGCWLYWVISGEHLLLCRDPAETLSATTRFAGLSQPIGIEPIRRSKVIQGVLRRLLTCDPESRYSRASTAIELLIVEAERIGGDNQAILPLLWNRQVMLQEELDPLLAVKSDHGRTTLPPYIVLRLSRGAVCQSGVAVLECIHGCWAPERLILGPDSDVAEFVRRINSFPPRTVIIDMSQSGGRLEEAVLRLIVEAIRLQEGAVERTYLLESFEGGDTRGCDLDHLLGAGQYVVIESDLPSYPSLGSWASALFSGMTLDSKILHELTEGGVGSPAIIAQILERACTEGALVLDSGRIQWKPDLLPTVRNQLRDDPARRGTGVAQHSEGILDLFETLPDGLAHRLVRDMMQRLPGWGNSVRELLGRGLLIVSQSGDEIAATTSPKGLVSRESATDAAARDRAAEVLRLSVAMPGAMGFLTHLALELRTGRSSSRDVLRVLLHVQELQRATRSYASLRLLEAIRRSGGVVSELGIRARFFRLVARALAQLREHELASAYWRKAQAECQAAGKSLQAARIAFEREYLSVSLTSGFTRDATALLAELDDGRARKLELYYLAEELVVQGFKSGFRSVRSDFDALLDKCTADGRTQAVACLGLGRAALEDNDTVRARELGSRALTLARAAGDRGVIARALNFLSVFELTLGRTHEARQYGEEQRQFLDNARWSQRIAVRTFDAATAYEQGRIHDVVEIELENFSESVLVGQLRAESAVRRNLAIAYLALNRLWQSQFFIDSLIALRERNPTLRTSYQPTGDIENIQAELLIEYGLFHEARELCERGRSEQQNKSGLIPVVTLRNEAIALGYLEKFAASNSAFQEALDRFREAGAIDECWETEIARANVWPRSELSEDDLVRVQDLAMEAQARGLHRIQYLGELALIRQDFRLDTATRRGRAAGLRNRTAVLGLGRIRLEALYLELVLSLEVGETEHALHLQQEAMEELRGVSEGLRAFPVYREAYFRDPRRQRFLEVGRRLAGGAA